MESSSSRETGMASSSSSSKKYDVFISFRGEDTRKTFVDHLFTALHQQGIVTFQDTVTLERGKSINPELFKAIEESFIAVIIFSKSYASSTWCLDELMEIMKQHDEGKLIVYPVFYGVVPSDVRKQKGPFGEVFSRLQGGSVEGWKDALVKATSLSGWDTKEIANGHEAECIKSLIKDIQEKVHHRYSTLKGNLTGIRPRVEKLKSLLRMGSNDVRMIGIWGMGGAGKTTLASAAFDELSNLFDSTRFVRDIRETTKNSGLPSVQKEMLSSIVRNVEIRDETQGSQMIMKTFCRQKVLIVLDDVDNASQLDALAGGHNWFGEGSLIIITTRIVSLLFGHVNNEDLHHVELLNDDEALHLFSQSAFRRNIPIDIYEQQSRLVVRYAAGHPLTLKVLGNSLRGKDMKKWITTVDRLKEIPKTDVLKSLEISFDSLEDIEKEIFLDITCLFKGWPDQEVYKILDCCGFETEKWVSDLVERSLIYISSGRLYMHDIIQEMGEHIVRGENREPNKHSRLWKPKEVLHILTENKGTEEIRAIVVKGLNSFELVDFTHAFKNMTNLRLLYVDSKEIQFLAPDYFPSSLKYLQWQNYAPNSRSTWFGSWAQPVLWKGVKSTKLTRTPNPSLQLARLSMRSNNVVKLWKGVKHLHNLKSIDCRDSKKLTRTPDFRGVPHLEELYLSGCSSLIKVHESIGTLKKLEILDLRDCYELRSFPSHIEMKSLKSFMLQNCYNFKRFPEIQGTMDKLSEIDLEKTAIEGLPSSIENLPNLESLYLSRCGNLASLPFNIGMLRNLKTLNVIECFKLTTLPEDLGNLECIERLYVSSVTQLPSSVSILKNLKEFFIIEPPFFDPHRNLPRYSSHQVLSSLSSLTSLKKLGLSNLQEGMILPVDISTLASLEYLDICYSQFTTLPFSISQLHVLKTLLICDSPRLQALPELPPSMFQLNADGCTSLTTITGLLSAKGSLRQASFNDCCSLEDDAVLQNLVQGHDAVTHHISILYDGSEIPDWFHSDAMGDGEAVIVLPADWHDVISGILICIVGDIMGLSRPVTLTLSTQHIASRSSSGSYHPGALIRWMEYVPIDLLRLSCEGIVRPDWMTSKGLMLRISTESVGVKMCGVRLVYRDNGMADEVLECFRETECDAITYTLQPGIRCVPVGDANVDKLSWIEKHELFKAGDDRIQWHTKSLL